MDQLITLKLDRYTNGVYSRAWISEKILYQQYKPNLVITLDVAFAMAEQRKKICGAEKFPLITCSSHLSYIDKDSESYLASKEACQFIKAEAIYFTTSIAKWAANFYLLQENLFVPTKLFIDQEEAINWLKGFKI